MDNERKIAQLEEDLKTAQGDLVRCLVLVKGEAGDFAGKLAKAQTSVLNTQIVINLLLI